MTYCLDDLFEKFVWERIYLQNVSKKTVYFYRQAWKAFRKTHKSDEVSKDHLTEFLISIKEQGAKPVSINTCSRALNAFFNWAHQSEHLPEKLVIPKLKEDKPALKTVSEAHIKAVLAFKPYGFQFRCRHI